MSTIIDLKKDRHRCNASNFLNHCVKESSRLWPVSGGIQRQECTECHWYHGIQLWNLKEMEAWASETYKVLIACSESILHLFYHCPYAQEKWKFGTLCRRFWSNAKYFLWYGLETSLEDYCPPPNRTQRLPPCSMDHLFYLVSKEPPHLPKTWIHRIHVTQKPNMLWFPNAGNHNFLDHQESELFAGLMRSGRRNSMLLV